MSKDKGARGIAGSVLAGLTTPGAGYGDQVARANADIAQTFALVAGSRTTKDLFNPNDPDVAFGRYIVHTTGATSGGDYNATGYIPVEQGATYTTLGPIAANRRAYYDADLTFVSGVYDGGAGSFTIPTGTGIAFMRLTVPYANWAAAAVYKSSVVYAHDGRNRNEPDEIQRWLLRHSHSKLLGLALGESLQFIVNLGGDSYTHNAARYADRVTTYLTTKFGDAGGGWCGFGFIQSGNTAPWTTGNQPSYLNGNARPSVYPVRAYGAITGNYSNQGTADLASGTMAASGDAYEVDFPASPTISGIDLHWIGTGAGAIRYTLDGGSNWTSLTVSGTSGTTAVTALSLTGLSQPGTLRIEWVSGTAKLGGVNLKSTAYGVRVNKIAATGSSSQTWATGTALAGFVTSLQSLGGHLFSWMDGPNDQGGFNENTFATYVQTAIGNVKTAIPGIDVLFLVPPENARANSYKMAEYERRIVGLAVYQRFAAKVVRFGDGFATSEYASAGSIPLLDADNLHPNTSDGGRLLASEWLRMVLPFGSI